MNMKKDEVGDRMSFPIAKAYLLRLETLPRWW